MVSEENETEENLEVVANPSEMKWVIPLEKIKANYKSVIRVHVKWTNDEQKNLIDTELGKRTNANNRKIRITGNINFKQYIGEELTL